MGNSRTLVLLVCAASYETADVLFICGRKPGHGSTGHQDANIESVTWDD